MKNFGFGIKKMKEKLTPNQNARAQKFPLKEEIEKTKTHEEYAMEQFDKEIGESAGQRKIDSIRTRVKQKFEKIIQES